MFPNDIDFGFLALPENSGAGTLVQMISATDADLAGTYDADITYRIEDTTSIFGIEPKTGIITLHCSVSSSTTVEMVYITRPGIV